MCTHSQVFHLILAQSFTGDMTTPSIAAVVASLDDLAGKYATSVRVQPNRTEVIGDLKDMVLDLLKSYYA